MLYTFVKNPGKAEIAVRTIGRQLSLTTRSEYIRKGMIYQLPGWCFLDI